MELVVVVEEENSVWDLVRGDGVSKRGEGGWKGGGRAGGAGTLEQCVA